ncbi:hypothetical protein SAMN02745121_00768 [Nannocystis exedens]|uniref:Lipoprotein n=1 Tax=Nannocystis exedens TaxID=54 RepID=A0A1I1TP88_9BACT|nr:hypothetical protein [Nannocystis exedens]PCC66503.1 hypothetical protein NAEX_09091 [Nannocystis exedens]SFD59008.1 hypothetical protein SAMN02745121_00768 [Nannocystis exedens]
MRGPLLLAALVSTACAAHEPAPQIRVPDEAAPVQAGEGRQVPSAAPEAAGTGAADEAEAPAAAAEDQAGDGGPVKQVESLAAAAYEDGKRAAQSAITQNQLGLETFGYPARCRREYSRILWEKYKVVLREVAGCVVDETIVEHARGYNEVMEAEIVRRHGADVFEKVSKQAGC